MRTLLWTYLGWRRFPRDLSPFEVRRFFSFTATDRCELRVRFPVRLRLGAALQLGFVRLTATTLDALDCVPRSVLEHVAHQLGMQAPELATLRALYRNERTRFAHQAWASAYAGFHWPDAADVTAIGDMLIAGASATLDRHRLARQAREALHSKGCLIPRERDIEDWVRRAIQHVELEDRQQFNSMVPAHVRDRWLPKLLSGFFERRRNVAARGWRRQGPIGSSPSSVPGQFVFSSQSSYPRLCSRWSVADMRGVGLREDRDDGVPIGAAGFQSSHRP